MKAVLITLVVIAALSAIASGLWVAIALVRAVSMRRSGIDAQAEISANNNDQ